MIYKDNWEETKKRYRAFWDRELDTPIIQVKAPGKGFTGNATWSWAGCEMFSFKDNPEKAIEKFEQYCKETYFGGDAFPNMCINMGPAGLSAYAGAEPRLIGDTVWLETPMGWDRLENIEIDPERNKWRQLTKKLTGIMAEAGRDKFMVGMPDFGGILDIISALRGSQNLLMDLSDCPEKVTKLSSIISGLWLECYNELDEIIRKKMCGSSAWMGLWSPEKWYPIECDFSAMISPKMFEDIAAPFIAGQCRYLDHTIYHLDGPGEIPHLDTLLDINELDGIQWVPVPGVGNQQIDSPVWIPMYKKIQAAGKLLVLNWVPPKSVRFLLEELSPKNLCIHVNDCGSREEADALLKEAENIAV